VGPAAGKATTQVDGTDVDTAGEIPLNPGEHEVSVKADGFKPVEKTVRLAEGAHDAVKIELAPIAVAAAPVEQSSGGSKVPAIVAFGVGAIGIGLGATFGIMAFGQAEDAKALCNGNVCSPAAADAIDSSRTSGTISTIGFIAGGVGVAAGVVLLIVAPGKSAPAPTKGVTRVTPWFGLGSAGVNGTF
jgi:hypothetical protein